MPIILGDERDNYLLGTAEADEILGLAGADTLSGRGGGDLLDGGSGADVIDSSAWYDDDGFGYHGSSSIFLPDTVRFDWATQDLTVIGESATFAGLPGETDILLEVENVWGGSGNDYIAGHREVKGGAGNDTLIGTDGDDRLWGGSGTDVLDGGAGLDIAVYSEKINPIRVDLAAGVAAYPGTGWANERLTSMEGALTGSGSDTLLGTAAANILDGGYGIDTIDGRGGRDTVSYASHGHAVVVDLVAQRGWISGASSRDILVSIENATGGRHNDFLIGTAGANVLDGGVGNDTIRAADGDDTILFSRGHDIVCAGGGTDSLVWDIAYDRYTDLQYSFELDLDFGIIREEYSGDTDVDFTADLAAGVATNTYSGGVTRFRSIEVVTTGVGNDRIVGSDRAETISVGHGANQVNAGGGDDVVYASNIGRLDDTFDYYFDDSRDAAEIVRGGAGDDTIAGATSVFGDAGDDTLIAGWYRNAMTGGTGADAFVFSDAFETDGHIYPIVDAQSGTITDFDSAEGDKIVIDSTGPVPIAPTWVGVVSDIRDIDIGEYGVVNADGALTFLLALGTEVVPGDPDEEFSDGVQVALPQDTVLLPDDVLFV
jgi:Ca2+-binding RTX toxin-like protein